MEELAEKIYPRYPAYKDSGIDWLGEIPVHWNTRRLKHLAFLSEDKLSEKPSNSLYIGLENIESGTGKLLIDNPIEHVESTVNAFTKGDILFGKLRPYLAKVAYPDFSGVCTSEILVLSPSKDLDGKFLFYLMLSDGFIKAIDSMTYGSKMPRTNSNQVGNMRIGVPPLEEQHAIADFLDRETARLDALIAKYRRLLELLEEMGNSIINLGVTGGVRYEAEEQGLYFAPWIIPLPPTWKRFKLKYRSYIKGRIGYENLRADEYTDEGPYLVSSAHFKDGKIDWERCNHVTRERFEMSPGIILQKDDVLFMKDGALMGKLAYVDELPGDACINSHLLIIRPLHGSYLPKFMYYLLGSKIFKAYMEQERKGTTFFGFSEQSMGNYPLSLPPIDEQVNICEAIDLRIKKIKTIQDEIEILIRLLQEYRTSLITSAVTGKIKVC